MSFNTKTSKNIPAFLQKTYTMLEDATNDCAIMWSPNGMGFVISNEELLTNHILPKYFKHSNYSSFIRQLNMYDFHKIRKGNFQNYFHHDKFVRGDLFSISQIKRKAEKKKTMKNIVNRNIKQSERFCYQNEISEQKRVEKQVNNKTEITLNSVHTIKGKSEQSIILMRQNTIMPSRTEQIYYEECESVQQNKFSGIDLNNGDFFQNDDDSSKMSINDDIQSKTLIEQNHKEYLVPSLNNIFTFINHYQIANFGLFL